LSSKSRQERDPKRERDTHTHTSFIAAISPPSRRRSKLRKHSQKRKIIKINSYTVKSLLGEKNWIANYYNNNNNKNNKNTASPYYNKKATDTLSNTPHHIYN
jgi:hypothetical protein